MISVTVPRTVAPRATPRPKTRQAKTAPLGRLGRVFPVARDIIEASSDHRRAAILLRLPDAIVLSHGDVVAAACREAGFAMGIHFLTTRSAVLHATRGPDGALPDHCVVTLQIWQRGLAALAAAEPR